MSGTVSLRFSETSYLGCIPRSFFHAMVVPTVILGKAGGREPDGDPMAGNAIHFISEFVRRIKFCIVDSDLCLLVLALSFERWADIEGSPIPDGYETGL